jgi:hypothetical protein
MQTDENGKPVLPPRPVSTKRGGNAETTIQKQVLSAIKKLPFLTLFRNNVGAVDTGNGRLMRFGVGGVGASDLIGYKSVVITPDMVGGKIAVFTAVELKTKTGKLTAEQNVFLQTVASNGGIAFVARSAGEVLDKFVAKDK